MLDKITVISDNLVNRADALITHLRGSLDSDEWKYDPELIFLTKELYLETLTLDHSDFLKLNAFINFKIGALINLYGDFTTPERNWLDAKKLINFVEEASQTLGWSNYKLFKSGTNALLLQHNLYGFENPEKFYNPAFYNWYAVNALNEEVVLSYRKTFLQSSYLQMLNRAQRSYLTRIGNIQTDTIVMELVETGERVELTPNKFYIVTDSTESCKILGLERFNSSEHGDFLLGNKLNGMVLKFSKVDDELHIQFLYNNLHCTPFGYSSLLLGLKECR